MSPVLASPKRGSETDPVCRGNLPRGTDQITFGDLLRKCGIGKQTLDVVALRVNQVLHLAQIVGTDPTCHTVTVEFAGGDRDTFTESDPRLLPVPSSYMGQSVLPYSPFGKWNPIGRTITAEEHGQWQRESMSRFGEKGRTRPRTIGSSGEKAANDS